MFRRNVDVVAAVGDSFNSAINVMLGRNPYTCDVLIPYPTNGNWRVFRCPLTKGHTTLHADETNFPFVSDDDVKFFTEHYDLWRAAQ